MGNRLLVGTSQVNDGTEVAHAWSVLDTQTLSAVAELWVKRLDGDVYWGGAWLGDRAVVLYYNETHAGSTIYDVRERKVMFAAPSVHPSNVALSPDGRWLAIIDSELGMIDVHTLDRSSEGSSTVALPRLVPQLHSGKITAMTMSDDATVVATAGDDAWISLWDRRSGRMFRRVDTGRRVIPLPASAESVALSADGRQVMASSAELFGLPTTIGIWDVASGERLQRLHDDINTFLTFLAPGDTQALMCNVERCRVQPLPLYGAEVGTILPTEFGARFAGQPMSLSTDESYLALALNKVNVDSEGNAVSSEASVGWMELDTNGRWGVISIPGDNWVGGVAALDGARVVAGLFNGDVLLVDGVRGRIVSGIPGYTTQILVRSIVPLDERRFVIGGLDSHGRHGVAIISSRDLSILQRMPGDELVDKPIDLLAVGGSGRWLAAGSSLSSDLLLWNTEGVDEVSHIRPRVIPAWRVQFDGHGGSLLVDGESVGSLWDLEDGHVYHQFRHRANDHRGQTFATLTDDGVAYLPPEESRAGLVIKSRQSVGRLGLGRVREWMVLELGEGGIEVVSVSSGESIWRREDVTNIRDVMLTQDRTGVVVTTVSHEMLSAIGEAIANRLTDEIRESIAESPGWWRELLDDFAYGLPNPDGQLFVFEAETGDTRFLLENSHWKPAIPVTNDGVVRDVLRLNHSLQIERISLTDGSVVDATHLGISSLAFAVSKPDGSMYLVADGNGQVVLWDTESGERSVFESSAIGVESVAFSSEGRVLATAETDGSVTLWDVSNGPRGVDRLASLVTFEDGDWAVVGTDGRYDASDPADLEGLAWVMPDAPTEPVPLSVFYRDYYEPRLLPRLLAGESFREIKSIADRDRKQPYVKIVAVEPTGAGRVNVTVEVSRGEAGGIGDLKLFRDGRLVGLDESATRPGGERRDRWRKTFRNIVLPTSGTELVEFSAYAFNADGVKSDTHRLAHKFPKVEPQPRRAFVVVVGVNAYENASWDLRYAADDARASAELITNGLKASDAFAEVHTIELITERDDETKDVSGSATRDDLRAVLDVLAGRTATMERLNDIPGATSLAKARPDDLVYLAFSGHGLSGEDGLFHLFLSDIGVGEGREVNEALLARTLDSDELAKWLLQVDAGDFVLVIDACNAAASVEGGGFKPGPMGSRGLGQLAYDKAMRVLAASQAEEVALESRRLRHGLLTYAMLREGLAGGAADRAPEDGIVDFAELLNYAVERVPLLYDDIHRADFVPQGKGLTVYTPSGVSGSVEVQRPRLFDFARGGGQVRIPVLHMDARSDL